MLNPLCRRSWAPKGRTPVLPVRGRHREKVNVIGALTVSPQARRLGLYFATDAEHTYNSLNVIRFLMDLLRQLPDKVIVIWDGASTHQGHLMREFLAMHPRLTLRRLPPYCPMLNPMESVWGWLKYGKLANFAPNDAEEIDEWAIEYLIELQHDRKLLRSLWKGSELPFPQRTPSQVKLPASQ